MPDIINYKTSREQALNGIDGTEMHYLLLNMFGECFEGIIGNHEIEDGIEVINMKCLFHRELTEDEKYLAKKKMSDYLEKEAEKKIQRTVLTEITNYKDRIEKIKTYCKQNNIEVYWRPRSEHGCNDTLCKNYQEFYFNRILTEKEKEEIKQLLTKEIIFNG